MLDQLAQLLLFRPDVLEDLVVGGVGVAAGVTTATGSRGVTGAATAARECGAGAGRRH